VALETVFQDLVTRIERVREELTQLWITVKQDPPTENAVPIERFAEVIEDAIGWIEEARAGAIAARDAMSHPMDSYRVRQELMSSQEQFFVAAYQFSTEIVSFERLAAVLQFCNEQDDLRWRRAWAPEAMRAVERCREPYDAAGRALYVCWRDLAERLSLASVSVQTTNVGQQITGASEFARAFGSEGIG